jgi:hypothetical protein
MISPMEAQTLSDLGGTVLSAPFDYFGAQSNKRAINRGIRDAQKRYGQANETMDEGLSQVDKTYSPFYQGATDQLKDTTDYLDNMKRPDLAELSKLDANSADPYMAKMSRYDLDASNRALENSGIASGASGGGLAREIANNSAKRSSQNFKDANQMATDAGNINFGQENTNFNNNANWVQNGFQNRQGLLNTTLGGANEGTKAAGAYRQGKSKNLTDLGDTEASGQKAKGMIDSNLWTGFGNDAGRVTSQGAKTIFTKFGAK